MAIDNQNLPNHIGFIVDGNRRWAKQQGKKTYFGHRKGSEILKKIIESCFDRGINYVSAYVFSTENWNRSEDEVKYLMDLTVEFVDDYVKDLGKKNIKIVQIGTRKGLSDKVLKAIDKAEEATKDNTEGTLGLCLNYGGQHEIVDAIKRLVESGQDVGALTPDNFQSYLYQPDIPALDYIVRTSGEHRLSNFMLWRAAYAELYFPETLWPDFKVAELDKALEEYAQRQRRFGQ